MNRKFFPFAILFLICFSAYSFSVYSNENDTKKCRYFLKNFGWNVSENATDFTEITIPVQFDNVYVNYNELQKKSNLNLLPYCGKHGIRYTFEVLNYPINVGETVYANVICIDGIPVGGDIMTASLSGFMHSLSENCPEK